VIRLAVRVRRDQAELVLAELLELAPSGVEEVEIGADLVEYAVYGAPGELPPLHFGVILGDFLHNLRGVLDHIIWQPVVLNGNEPTRGNAFPICDTCGDFDKAVDRNLVGLTDDQKALVAEYQPYRLGDDAPFHVLAVLRDLSNTDKHRFVHPTDTVLHDSREPILVFGRVGITTEALWGLERYVTYTVYERFAKLFPLPQHARRDESVAAT